MKILLAGGSGFVGTSLTKELSRNNSITVVDRNVPAPDRNSENIRYVASDLSKPGEWQALIPEQDVIINLAGATIFKKWDSNTKKIIYDSRILTTRNIADALKGGKRKKVRILSTSAMGYYGFHGDEIIDESFPPGTDFLAGVASDWEKEANRAVEFGATVVNCRFGIVLGKNGGALGTMLPLFRHYLGSRLGSGKQWFPWIHEKDLVGIYLFLIKNRSLAGPVNCTSPNPVTNRELTEGIKKALKKPSLIPFVPSFAIKILMGEFGNLILEGQRGIPKKLADHGYTFLFPTLEEALKDIIP